MTRDFNAHACLDCNHAWTVHEKNVGCRAGWEYDESGIATNEGCYCELSHARHSPREVG